MLWQRKAKFFATHQRKSVNRGIKNIQKSYIERSEKIFANLAKMYRFAHNDE